MKKNEKDTTFRFGIVEDDGKNVTIEIREEDYRSARASSVPEDELLKPGRHVFIRGGFLDRHPNFRREDIEIRVINDETEKQFASEDDTDKKAA